MIFIQTFEHSYRSWLLYLSQVVNVNDQSVCLDWSNLLSEAVWDRIDWNGSAMPYYHRSVDITPEEVVDEFAHYHPRRMLLVNPFQ